MSTRSNFYGGVGLRPSHYQEFLNQASKPSLKWLEVISENYFRTQGRPIKVLEKLRENYEVSCHGVSLSIASPEKIDPSYAKDMKEFYKRVEPFVVSDHMCWTGFSAHNVHDLLPFPYTQENLKNVVEKIQWYQEFLGRELAFENLSAYVQFRESDFTEEEFFQEILKRSGAKMLLDVNNIYVNSQNFDFDPLLYLQKISLENVVQIHLAGYSDMGNFLFDTHSRAVQPGVWELFKKFAAQKSLNCPVMIEWDDDIPKLSVVVDELHKAQEIWEGAKQGQGKLTLEQKIGESIDG